MRIRYSVGFVLAMGLPLSVLAAGTASIQMEGGEKANVSWLDKANLRMDIDASSYLLMRDGKVYTVSRHGGPQGKPMVMEMGDMMKQFASIAQESDSSFSIPELVSVESAGKSETVAGIKGDVYTVKTKDNHGKQETTEFVLTDHALTVELTQAYMSNMQSMLGSQEQANAFMAALPKKKSGILRIGKQWTLNSISSKAPSADEFEFPAPPVSMADFMQKMMGEALKNAR